MELVRNVAVPEGSEVKEALSKTELERGGSNGGGSKTGSNDNGGESKIGSYVSDGGGSIGGESSSTGSEDSDGGGSHGGQSMAGSDDSDLELCEGKIRIQVSKNQRPLVFYISLAKSGSDDVSKTGSNDFEIGDSYGGKGKTGFDDSHDGGSTVGKSHSAGSEDSHGGGSHGGWTKTGSDDSNLDQCEDNFLIQISKNKRPCVVYLKLAKKYIEQYYDVELTALGMAVAVGSCCLVPLFLKGPSCVANSRAVIDCVIDITTGMVAESSSHIQQQKYIKQYYTTLGRGIGQQRESNNGDTLKSAISETRAWDVAAVHGGKIIFHVFILCSIDSPSMKAVGKDHIIDITNMTVADDEEQVGEDASGEEEEDFDDGDQGQEEEGGFDEDVGGDDDGSESDNMAGDNGEDDGGDDNEEEDGDQAEDGEHDQVEDGEHDYLCPMCPKQFNLLSGLKCHQKDKHSRKFFGKCRTCGVLFGDLNSLQDHSCTDYQ